MLNVSPIPDLLQFIGNGNEGDALLSLMEETLKGSYGNSPFTIRTNARCRTCVTLIDSTSGDATEIIEPSQTIETGMKTNTADCL